MDNIDRKICGIMQSDGRATAAELAKATGLSTSSAHDRLRRLLDSGVLKGIRAIPEPTQLGAGLCAFVLIDMAYEGEKDACAALTAQPEVMELHHIAGAHSYLAKLRVADTAALLAFLSETVKPLPAITRTETILALHTLKETTELPL